MTKTYFPFDAGAGATVIETQWSKMARLFCPTGVVKNQLNQLEPFGDSTGMNVKVRSGQAFVEGFFFESDAQETLTISAAHATLPRIDRAIVRLDRTANTIDLAVLTGTPNAVPVAPTLTQSSTTWEISLARVAVGAAVTSITAGNVTDERTFTVDWTADAVPQIVLKSADEGVSDTTLINDALLKFNIPASEKRFIDLYLIVTAATTVPDFKCRWTVPTGASMNWGLDAAGEKLDGFAGVGAVGTTPSFKLDETQQLIVGLGNGTVLIHIAGWVIASTTAGVVQFQWAENSVSGTVTVKANSFLKHYRIG